MPDEDYYPSGEDTPTQECPCCDGKGFEIEYEYEGAKPEKVECLKCSGSGVVTWDTKNEDLEDDAADLKEN